MGRLSDFHETYTVEAVEEDGAVAIRFDDKWYRDRDDFFAKACIDDDRLTSIFDFFEDFEVC